MQQVKKNLRLAQFIDLRFTNAYYYNLINENIFLIMKIKYFLQK